MAITDTQAKINDIINKSLSANASTVGDIMRDDVASGMQDLLNEIVSMLVDIGDLDVTKLDKGNYTGNASDLKSYLESLISACTQKGTYSGTAGQLKAMIDSLATTGTITPDLKNYMELIKDENNVKVVQGVPIGGQKYFGEGVVGAIKIKLPTHMTGEHFTFKIKIIDSFFSSGATAENTTYIVKGYNRTLGFGTTVSSQAVCVMNDIKNVKIIPRFYFYNSVTNNESYIIIGNITDTHNMYSVIISDVSTHRISVDWSTGWELSSVTELETVTSSYLAEVTPTLNATHLNGTTAMLEGGGGTIPITNIDGSLNSKPYLFKSGSVYSTDSYLFNRYIVGYSNIKNYFMIILCETARAGTVNKIDGTFFGLRASSTANFNYYININIQTSETMSSILKFDSNIDDLRLGTINYKGVSHYAVYIPSLTVGTLNTTFGFSGIWRTTSTDILKPTVIEAYTTNTDITSVKEIDSIYTVSEGFVKKTVSAVKSFLMSLPILIKKTDTNSISVQNDSGVKHFGVDTTNRITDIKSFISKYKGTSVASATTIVPTGEIFHVTGTTAIATITPPTGLTDCMQITIIPDGVFTTTTEGNIALATTSIVGKALTMTYDATTSKWYPSY